ncbi:MAG: hypothetical protein KDD39_09405 [Bdellovibrionales bacterium]|nr:hypothetical protein [Bdellovibrionales bacterium]
MAKKEPAEFQAPSLPKPPLLEERKTARIDPRRVLVPVGPVEKPAATASAVLEGTKEPDPVGLDPVAALEDRLVAVAAVPLLVERRLAAQRPDKRAPVVAVLREAPEVRENPVAIRPVRFKRSPSMRLGYSNNSSPVGFPKSF